MSYIVIRIIFPETAGDIRKNQVIMENVPKGHLTEKIIENALKGTPMIQIGDGNPKLMLNAGIHGNELPPQTAALELADNLALQDIRGTVFIIPFAVPQATINGSRRFEGFDMNRTASKEGYLSSKIVKMATNLKINSFADFHSTKPHSNPGVESIFCSKKPCPQSYKIAEHIKKATSSRIICHNVAGTYYSGALEDECNLSGIPAVTCEVVSQDNKLDPGSQERSYLQMETYLEYFDVI
jgi:uncharacterized protein